MPDQPDTRSDQWPCVCGHAKCIMPGETHYFGDTLSAGTRCLVAGCECKQYRPTPSPSTVDEARSPSIERNEMFSNVGQYEYEIREDGERLDGRVIDDPFLVSRVTFVLSRLDAFKAIFRPLVKVYETRVKGTGAAHRVVFTGDYTPPPPAEQSDAVGFYVRDAR